MRINTGYIVVKEISFDSVKTNFYFDKNHNGESQFAIVIGVNKNSLLKVGEVILHDKCIMFYDASIVGESCYYIKEEEVFAKLVKGDLISIRESVYVEVDKEANHTLNVDGLVLEKDTRYDEFSIYNRTQHGKVISVPLYATNSYTKGDRSIPIDLKVGDIVYSHHFITHEDNERIINNKKVYEIRYEECYCRERDGELTSLNEWNLVTPINEEETKQKYGDFYLKEDIEKETDLGLIKLTSNKLKSLGVHDSSKVLFKHKRNYPIIVKGDLYYRVNTRDIVAQKIDKNG